jgi:uncharacterized membrane protein
MKDMSTVQLWDSLKEGDFIVGESAPAMDHHSPWFVRIMLGFAGWIGALFILGFLGVSMQFIFRSSGASLIAGTVLCSAAALIFRFFNKNDFACQFGLATSFAGQAVFIHGLMDLFRIVSGPGYLTVMIFEVVLVALISNYIHRMVSAFIAAICFSLALSYYSLPNIAPALITIGFTVLWLNELKWARWGKLVQPVGYGLVLAAAFVSGALLMHAPMWFAGRGGISPEFVTFTYYARVILNGAVFIFAISSLLKREGIRFKDTSAQIALIAALVIAISSFKAPGIITGLIVILLGFANGNKTLTGLGILASIAYLSHFYYQMHATLLMKSVALTLTGTVALIARFSLSRIWSAGERKGGDIHA